MREILAAAGAAAERERTPARPPAIAPDDARLALGVYVHRLRGAVASMAAVLGGLDALAFTGGVGEKSPEVRRLAVEGLGFLGLAIDGERNVAGEGDRVVSAAGSTALTLVVESREDLEIARSVRRLLDPAYAGEEPDACRPAA